MFKVGIIDRCLIADIASNVPGAMPAAVMKYGFGPVNGFEFDQDVAMEYDANRGALTFSYNNGDKVGLINNQNSSVKLKPTSDGCTFSVGMMDWDLKEGMTGDSVTLAAPIVQSTNKACAANPNAASTLRQC